MISLSYRPANVLELQLVMSEEKQTQHARNECVVIHAKAREEHRQ